MKYLVVSDLHGSLFPAKFIQKTIQEGQVDGCLILGDVLYHGPRNALPTDYDPQGVLSLLNTVSKKIIAVQGNCDSEVDQMVLEFPIMAKSNQLFLGNRKVFMTHGHEGDLDCLAFLDVGDICLSGHTHIPTAKNHGKYYQLNPGSIAIPKGGYLASYGILDEDGFAVYTMDAQQICAIQFERE